jgi:4-diphosphocytidyl-2-C-methyl-D-erythritol kinase
MIVFPNCKINLGLRILNKRQDGYHNIETIFYPVPLKDALEIIVSENAAPVNFSSSGFIIDGDTENNLCTRAYHLLKKDFPQITAVKIHLHKAIPMGAGLGGGSADAAFTLQLLNQQFNLNLSAARLITYALQLGSDCPFFILNKPCLATGRGEIMEELTIDFSAYKIILVNPGIHVNTAHAFAALSLNPAAENLISLREIIQQPVTEWHQSLKNDFEETVTAMYPAIKEIKDTLYKMGATYASMTGSGSTVYGLFKKQLQPDINFNAGYFVSMHSL